MNADRRRHVLADVSAALLIAGATASGIAVSLAGESARFVTAASGLAALVVALVVAGFALRERRAKFVASLAALGLCTCGGLAAYEYLAPPVFAPVDEAELPAKFRRLAALHVPLALPKSGEWLNGNVELGQSYGQYIGGDRIRPDDVRRVIYLQPLGEFDDQGRKIIRLTAEFLGLFYQLPVRVNEDLPLALVPESGRRTHPKRGTPRLLTKPVLRELLKPRLPDDAVAMLALTTAGLSPHEEAGTLLGQASLVDRVGVWSLAWLDDPAGDEEAFVRNLRRTLRISSHETGHMFSLEHCIFYRCGMNGANGLRELDTQPLWFCPQCQAKVAYATGGDPAKQLSELITFADTHGLAAEAVFWRKSLAALRESP